MLGYNNLSNYYFFNHYMTAVLNKYSLTEIENMIPFEREIYFSLYKMHLEQRNKEDSE
ncbi:hypothetical protein [Caulobacter phage Cr30]|uniref:baseplate hub assembly catalyst n=1 Tax=Caulobacter phage Cr30 TaxID=1357714 RepID=UPI0004A9B7E0|nr:baseplate hub assembly catalyst [Caulobacter phage Cr30]AGS81136.1 hypothetical protein [Caulobacter phage Cr30]